MLYLTKHHALKTCGAVEVNVHALFTSVDGFETLASRSGRFIPRKQSPVLVGKYFFIIKKIVGYCRKTASKTTYECSLSCLKKQSYEIARHVTIHSSISLNNIRCGLGCDFVSKLHVGEEEV